MPNDRDPIAQQEIPVSDEDLEQEVYTALRAAGASPEEAQSCLQARPPKVTP